MSRLQGRVAIVTGSSSGIGQAIAKRLATDGANVVINYMGHPEGAQETLRMVEAAGAKGAIVKADVSKVDEALSLLDEAGKTFNSADILVNNAGVEHKTSFLETREDDFDRVIGVNLKAPFFVTQAFTRKLAAE